MTKNSKIIAAVAAAGTAFTVLVGGGALYVATEVVPAVQMKQDIEDTEKQLEETIPGYESE